MKKGDWVQAYAGIGRIERLIKLPAERFGSLGEVEAMELVHYRQLLNYNDNVRMAHQVCALRLCNALPKRSATKIERIHEANREKFEALKLPKRFGMMHDISLHPDVLENAEDRLLKLEGKEFIFEELEALFDSGKLKEASEAADPLTSDTLLLFHGNYLVKDGKRVFSRVSLRKKNLS